MKKSMFVSEEDRQTLERAYAGRKLLQGELHDHAYTGGTSDGKCSLGMWQKEMKLLGMDFAAILDHKQVRHMYLPEWDDACFVCGTEPGTRITDSAAEDASLHYNMLFPKVRQLEKLLEDFPEFEFTGGSEGHFIYPSFTTARFQELIDAVMAGGGFFVLPHPKQIMISEDPETYFFRDGTGIEVFYNDLDSKYTEENYGLYLQLLAAGHRLWACAGGDLHNHAGTGALTTLYAAERTGPAMFPQLRTGDFTCGSAGVRMVMGETRMGGEADFCGQKLIFSVGDLHDSVVYQEHTYYVELWDDRRLIFREEIDPTKTSYFSVETEKDAGFYRVEVWDGSRRYRTKKVGYCIAMGNPIWRRDWMR